MADFQLAVKQLGAYDKVGVCSIVSCAKCSMMEELLQILKSKIVI